MRTGLIRVERQSSPREIARDAPSRGPWSRWQCRTRQCRKCRPRCGPSGGSSAHRHRRRERNLMRSAKARGGGAARAHTNEVAEVRDVVNVGQGACDEDVSLAGLREDGGLLGGMVHRVCACGQRERAVPGDPFACKARCATLYASLTRPMCFVEISRSSRFARTLPAAHSSAGRTVCTARRVRRGDAAPAPGRLVLWGRRPFRAHSTQSVR